MTKAITLPLQLSVAIAILCLGVNTHAAEMDFVAEGRIEAAHAIDGKWKRGEGHLVSTGKHYLYAGHGLGSGDFEISARLSLDQLAGTAAAFVMDGNQFGFEGQHGKMFVQGPQFGKSRVIADPKDFIQPGKPFDLEVSRQDKTLAFRIDGRKVWTIDYAPKEVRAFGLRPWRATMRIYEFSATGRFIDASVPKQPKELGVPTIDISGETNRHVIVAAGTESDYRGQVNTVLMGDGKTIFAVWSIGHGGKCGPMKKSVDGGLTWSDMIPTPENWGEVGSCPCIFRVKDTKGVGRLFVCAGRPKHYRSMSLDGGETWTPMEETGLFKPGGNTAVIPIDGGRRHLLLMQRGPEDMPLDQKTQAVWQAISSDGGLTWQDYRKVCEVPGAVPCEPDLIRSPDGRQIACLMRENSRRLNSLVMFSKDEGRDWSEARELPASLTGDRHMSSYAPDGRLVVVFRDRAPGSPTYGHYVAWIGTYDDIRHNRRGQYRVKLLHSHAGPDCGYSGLERLPDGTMVATTYIKYRPGPKKHSIVSVRFKLEEIDEAFERWENISLKLPQWCKPAEPDVMFREGEFVAIVRNQAPANVLAQMRWKPGDQEIEDVANTNMKTRRSVDTSAICFNPVTERFEVVQSKREDMTINLLSIAPEDWDTAQWRFEGRLFKRGGSFYSTADGFHTGGAVIDQKRGVQHIFFYSGHPGGPAGVFRHTRTLNTPKLSAFLKPR